MSPRVTKPADERTDDRPLLMSLRPRFAQAILNGTKTVELRRTRVAALPGTLVIIYASAPVMSVVGLATLAAVDTARPTTLWRRHRRDLGITRAEFDAYLTGAETATCLTISAPQELPNPYPLTWLRGHAHFQPPQSYRYLAQRDPAPLHDLVASMA